MITYFSEDINYTLPDKRKTSAWLKTAIIREGFTLTSLNYVFCSDEYLLQINRDYLEHDYYTDIVTFNQSEDETRIEGDIFISIERVRENATTLNVEFLQELKRVMIHGLLHLCGYDDHSEVDQQQIRAKEDNYLALHSTA